MNKIKSEARVILTVGIDFLLLISSFYLFAYLKPGSHVAVLSQYESRFWIFAGVWVVVSLWFDKYNFKNRPNLIDFVRPVMVSNFFIIGLVSIAVVLIDDFKVSRYLFFGTAGLATIGELVLASVNALVSKARSGGFQRDQDETDTLQPRSTPSQVEQADEEKVEERISGFESICDAIREESGEEVLKYMMANIRLQSSSTMVVSTTTRFNLLNLGAGQYKTIVNLKRINDIQRINKFFETVNSKLNPGGLFVGCAETYVLRKQRILRKYPPVLNYLVYAVDFVFKRLAPKFYITKGIYFFITRGHNRVISRAETLGRLYSCGFEVVREEFVSGMLYFIVRKVKEPAFDFHPTYGPLIRLNRVGKGGKMIGVYKMRTMHAYSEYIQKYVFEQNDLQDGGKIADDFRVTTLGRIMRKFWLDELPMLINLVRGDLKLVGVRPLSRHYFSLYTPELQELRTRYKPGLVPPFYVDMPVTFEEIMESEKRYLEAYARHPFLTDWKYFWKSFVNIVFRKARSN